MTPAEATRPVLIVLTALALASCGAVEGDRHRFRTMADHVASIDIPMDPARPQRADDAPQPRADGDQGLRPVRFSPVKVALMTPHEMWDARDVQAGVPVAGLRDAVVRMAEPAVEPMVRAAAPVVTKAAVEHVVEQAEQPRLRPAVINAERRTIQLGAYSSEAGARQAWARLKLNAGLSNLSPVFEGVEVNGRSLTRLKVGPIPAEAASALCQAAQVADPWCRRAG